MTMNNMLGSITHATRARSAVPADIDAAAHGVIFLHDDSLALILIEHHREELARYPVGLRRIGGEARSTMAVNRGQTARCLRNVARDHMREPSAARRRSSATTAPWGSGAGAGSAVAVAGGARRRTVSPPQWLGGEARAAPYLRSGSAPIALTPAAAGAYDANRVRGQARSFGAALRWRKRD